MQPTAASTSDISRQEAVSAAGQHNDHDASSIYSAVSQDTDMAEIDNGLSKSAKDAATDFSNQRFTGGLAKLIFGADVEQIRIDSVRASNKEAINLRELVCVFVGGTGGIGKSTALELYKRTVAPKAYIIGRDPSKGKDVVRELKQTNPGGQAVFLQCDVSLLKTVDGVCEQISRQETKINCLMLTAGYLSVQGRDETVEGIDRKMTTNYYSRMRWALNLMPLLTAAADRRELSRVLSVLAAGSEGKVYMDDLDLQRNFSLHACMAHCVLMTDFMTDQLARRFPGTAFVHAYPGSVKTGIANELTGAVRLATKVLYAIMSPWILNVQESGERHFFELTSQCYPAKKGSSAGIAVPHGLHVMPGFDGEIGSGAYLLDWDGKPTGDRKFIERYRAVNFGQTAWQHTLHMFDRADWLREGKGEKRAADTSPESSARPAWKRSGDNPVGWRAA